MLSCEAHFFLLHVEWHWSFYFVFTFFNVSYRAFFFQFRERIAYSLDIVFFQFALYYWVVVPVNERVLFCLILYDTHLCVYIVLHAVVVSVKMIWGDVQQYSDVGTEIVHIVELERTELDDIVLVWFFSHLQGQ